MNPNDVTYIKHILDAINDIESSIKGLSKEKFQKSKDIRDACVRRLEIIGEAVKNISQETKAKYPLIEWKKIAGTRDMIIHSYFNVDLDVIWGIIKKDIFVLEKQMLKIKRELE